METALVTGGSGLIGKHIVSGLLKKGYAVISVDKEDDGYNDFDKENTIDKVSGNVLDLGCGYGPIGLSLASVSDHVTMIDVNKRAVHLTNRNIKDNNITNCEVLENDGLDGISSKFNFIVTNPPIRVGKEKLYSLMEECMNHLEDSGEMFLVIRKEQGANSFIKDMSLKYSVKVIDKSKGFYIISLKFC